jgi:hypothetical protein
MGTTQMDLSGNVRAVVSVTGSREFDLASGAVALSANWAFTVDSQAAARTCDLVWQDEGTIGAGQSVTIDLNGTLAADPKDYWGADARFDRVRALSVRNITSGAGEGESVLEVGGGSDGSGTSAFKWFFSAASGKMEVAPGGVAASAQGQDGGWPVTDTSADILRLSNKDGSNALSYQIIVIGESVQSAATTTTTEAVTTTTVV